MKRLDYLKLIFAGAKKLILRDRKPILGTIIVTDYCNLHCKHCAVNNINKVIYTYDSIVKEMENFYREGIRILFLSGGETLLWEDGNRKIDDLIIKGREIGFLVIAVVTNGTITCNIPGADLVFLSLDGMKETHDSIRGETFDTILTNLERCNKKNITVFMAINRLNYKEIEALTRFSKSHSSINGISFNFHTPYRTTEDLCLNSNERREAVGKIRSLINDGYPVFNLKTTLNSFLKNRWKRPCPHCTVSENMRRWVCGRCSEIDGLCEKCGYLFAIEFSKIFSGNPIVIWDMLRTYWRFI